MRVVEKEGRGWGVRSGGDRCWEKSRNKGAGTGKAGVRMRGIRGFDEGLGEKRVGRAERRLTYGLGLSRINI